MNAVERILSGKDGRSFLQQLMIRRSQLVVQVSLNIPGFPKKLDGGRLLVDIAGVYFGEKALNHGWEKVCSIFIDNGAGPACLLEIPGGNVETLKRIAMDIESRPWGGVLDIDVYGARGAIHRRDLGESDRKCFLCGGSAKICAREQRHDIAFLREMAAELIQAGLEEMFC